MSTKNQRTDESRALVEQAIRLYDQNGNVAAAGQLRAFLAGPPIEA